jgi:mono/diheme cytochrome c family protein
MRRSMVGSLVLGAAMICAAGASFAQAGIDLGKREYVFNCGGCHGETGKGDGPYMTYMKRPSDITQLAKKNNGVFPVSRVYEVIDGRQDVAAHGPRDMPIWGMDYQAKAGAYYMDVPYNPEVYVRIRILALIEYLDRLQVR